MMKVIIPTMMERCWEAIKGRPADELYEVLHYGKYEFTLGEAFVYLNEHPFEFEGVILHNVCLRDMLRVVGAAQLIAELREIVEPSARLDMMMGRFVDKWSEKSIADFDIQVLPIMDKLEIGGHTFNGLDEIVKLTEISITGCLHPCVTKKKVDGDGVHVGQVYQRYPCFDSSDYAYENRYYQNYIVREKVITEMEMHKLNDIRSAGNGKRIHEQTPEEMLPMVYYEGEGGFLLLATSKK